MRILIFLTLSLCFLFAEQLIIDANKFEAHDDKGFSVFTGNVKLKKANDILNADKLEVYITKKTSDKKREPIKYIATGNVSFTLKTLDKEYEGKGDKVVYDPSKLEYIVTGNGYLKEKIEDKTLYGDKIFINQATGEAKVSGTKGKPVRFIINIDEKKPKENKTEDKNTEKKKEK